MPEQIAAKRGQEVKWDTTSTYFRQAVRAGDITAHTAICDAVYECLSPLDDQFGTNFRFEMADQLTDEIVEHISEDQTQIEADEEEIAEDAKQETKKGAP